MTKNIDKYGVKFSQDGKELIKCPKKLEGEYVIPDGVETIASEAFKHCRLLTAVILPDSLKSIGDYAFQESGLKEIAIPEGVKYVGKFAFWNCKDLRAANIPEFVGVLTAEYKEMYLRKIGWEGPVDDTPDEFFYPNMGINMGYSIFAGCENLSSPVMNSKSLFFVPLSQTGTYVIPEGIEYIISAFNGCKYLEEVVIPDSVKYIGIDSFNRCSNLRQIDIPDTVMDIANYAFANCSNLISVRFPKVIDGIAQSTFEDCVNLKDVTLSEGIESIEIDAFRGCKSLEQIKLPQSLTEISGRAFADCEKLASVFVSRHTEIDELAFNNCPNLKDLTYID